VTEHVEARGAWNPRRVAVVAFLWVFPGVVLHALNYGRLGLPERVRPALVRNLVVTLLAYAVAPVIVGTDDEWLFAWGLLVHIAGAVYCQHSQFVLFMRHIRRGGRQASVVVPALALFALFGVALVLLVSATQALD
jgi:hypothetical protein